MNLSVADLQRIVGGQLRLGQMPPRDGELTAIGNLVTDSRLVKSGDVFWGLRGARHDGSNFAEEALARGAIGVVTDGRWAAPWAGGWSLEVGDSAVALWRLAEWNCQRLSGQIVTLEGAVGKTTAGAMIDAVLNVRFIGRFATSADGSSSAHGTAISLAGLPAHSDYAVVELHDGVVGQSSELGRLARPDIAVFIHSGDHCVSHQSPSLADPAVIKRLRLVNQTNVPFVVNGDDLRMRRAASDFQGTIFVGRGSDNHISATNVESAGGLLRFTVDGSGFCVRAWGRHHLTSALAAIAVGRGFGLSDAEISAGLAAYQPGERAVTPVGHVTVIVAGHGQPAATQAAMELLRESTLCGRRVMVCGDMEETPFSGAVACAIGEQTVSRVGADLLIACGRQAGNVVAGAAAAGLPNSQAVVCETVDEARAHLLSRLRPHDAVLLSGRNLSPVLKLIEQPRGQERRAA